LKDLLYLIEGSPDFLDEAKTVYNIYKMDRIGEIISIFTTAQASYETSNTNLIYSFGCCCVTVLSHLYGW